MEPGSSTSTVCRDVFMAAQKSPLWVWVFVGMTLSPSFIGSRPASAQPSSEVARLITQLRDESPTVRRAAAYALGRIGPAAKDAAPGLAKLLTDPEADVQGAAASALVDIGAAAVPELTKLLKDPEAGVRRFAASILGRIGPAAKDAAPELAKLLTGPDADVRRAAAVALGRIGPAAKEAVQAGPQLKNQ
jgi:HEAT repeat protein